MAVFIVAIVCVCVRVWICYLLSIKKCSFRSRYWSRRNEIETEMMKKTHTIFEPGTHHIIFIMSDDLIQNRFLNYL